MSKITKAFATVSSLTILSRLLGFAREILTAKFLGASAVADAFFVALRLPNFLRQVFAEGALSVAFVPMMSQTLAEDRERAKRFAENTLSWLITILIPFCLMMMIFMPQIVPILLPGETFAPGTVRYALTVEMARITYPFLLCISVVALMGGVLNSLHKFAPFAAAPCIFNVVITIFLLMGWAAPDMFATVGHAMAYGLTVSGIVQILWMTWFLRKADMTLSLRLPKITPEAKRLLAIMIPAAFAGSVTQINLLLGQTIASFLPGGSVSYLYYAERLNQLPIGILGVAAGTALLPLLARAVKQNDTVQAAHYLSRTVEFCLFLGLPTALAFLILAEPIQITLFQRGEFTYEDARASARALMAMALGIPAFVVAKSFVTVLFAHQDTKTALKVSLLVTFTNIALAFLLIWPLMPLNAGHVAIALATSAAGWLNVILLARVLKKRGDFALDENCKKNVTQMLIAAGVMALALLVMLNLTQDVFSGFSELLRLATLGSICAVGGAIYIGLCFKLGALKWSDVKSFLKPVPKDPEMSTYTGTE